MKPKNLADVLTVYKKDLESRYSAKFASETYNQTLTALTRFTLPGMGHVAAQGRKPTKAEKNLAWQFMESIPLSQLPNLPSIQSQVFDSLDTLPSSRYTYSFRLKVLLDWAEQEIWYPQLLLGEQANRCPRRQLGHGSVRNRPTTGRVYLPPYGLKAEEYSESLQAEIDEFIRFYGADNYPGRQMSALSEKTVNNYVKYLTRIFGWFHHIQGVPQAQLSFDLLIAKVSLKYADNPTSAQGQAEKAMLEMEKWFYRYLDFLQQERKNKGLGAVLNATLTLYAVVRFQYYQETTEAHYKDIPAAKVLQNRLEKIRTQRNASAPVADESCKWLDLPDIWERVVTPLRHECAYQLDNGGKRGISAISRSFQLFVLWGLLTFRPPRRQRVFRELKIAMSCPIQRPHEVKPDQMIHPLPVERQQDSSHGYLYKAVDGQWYIDLQPESYKTGKSYGAQKLPVANPSFSDGRCFYDYLEAYLYGYYRDSQGNWLSGGQLATTPPVPGQWYKLRMLFNPTHNYVFYKPNSGEPYDATGLGYLISISAHRLTGQRVTPHLLRDIYATWFLEEGYTDDRIHSLAYAMGHSMNTLRKIYDRRHSQQKNRPIEEIVMSLLPNHVS